MDMSILAFGRELGKAKYSNANNDITETFQKTRLSVQGALHDIEDIGVYPFNRLDKAKSAPNYE